MKYILWSTLGFKMNKLPRCYFWKTRTKKGSTERMVPYCKINLSITGENKSWKFWKFESRWHNNFWYYWTRIWLKTRIKYKFKMEYQHRQKSRLKECQILHSEGKVLPRFFFFYVCLPYRLLRWLVILTSFSPRPTIIDTLHHCPLV